MTGARLLLAAIALLALAAPARSGAQPGAQAGPALAPRDVLDPITTALQRDDLAAAKAAIDPAIAAFPEDPVVRNLAGVIDARRGESRAAQDHFEAAIRLQPGAPAAYINLGRLLQERAGADPAARPAALAVYARLLAIDPQQPEALFQTAALHLLDGRFDAARQSIDRLPEAARGRPPVLAVRAVALAGSGDADGAQRTVAALAAHPQVAREDIDAVLPALARLPEHGTEQALLELLDRRGWATPATLRRLAAIDSAAGRYVQARAWLEKAAAGGVPDAALLIELARAAFKAGDAKGALGYLAHARDLEPTNVAVHFLFGIICVELNLGAEAYESLAKAVALAPDDPDVNYAMGAVSLHRHDPSEALPYFEAYVRLRPGDPRGRFALGAARYHSQQLEEARTDLAAAATDPQTAAGAHYYLARIARQRQDLETARREIDAALRANPSHADGWAERGLIETRQGDYAGAEAALQKALALDPDNYDATLHLAALYGRTRDPRKAAQEARLQTLVARREIRAQEFLRLVQAVYVTSAARIAAAVLATCVVAASSAAAGTQSPVKAPARKGAAATAPEPAGSAVVAATSALAAGDLDRAAALAAGHLRQHPRSAAARVVVARVHIARGDLDAAWRELNRAAAEHPRDVDVLYYLGQVSGQLAAGQFERLVQESPVSARGHQLLAESFEAEERRSDAEREYQAALAIKPDLLEALLGLARLQRIRLDCDGAKALYARAEVVRPTFDAAYGIGACLLREQEHDAARAQLERAVARDPQSAVALVGLGSALLGLNRAAEAIVLLERAVVIEPAMDDGWYVLGRAYQAAGRTDQAQRAFATVERLRAERPR